MNTAGLVARQRTELMWRFSKNFKPPLADPVNPPLHNLKQAGLLEVRFCPSHTVIEYTLLAAGKPHRQVSFCQFKAGSKNLPQLPVAVLAPVRTGVQQRHENALEIGNRHA